MDIYLIIIIGYILFRVARLLFKSNRLTKLLGLKRVWISGNLFIIKKLTPLDFSGKGLPFTYFSIGSGLDVANQLRVKPETDEVSEDDYKRIIENAKLMYDKAVVYSDKGVTSKTIFESDKQKAIKIGLELYQKIIEYNFLLINKIHKMNKVNCLNIAELCHAFGKKPHEHVSNPKKLTSLEKYMIDEFFYGIWIERQNEIAKAQEGR